MPCKGFGEAALPAALGSSLTIAQSQGMLRAAGPVTQVGSAVAGNTENTPKASGLRDLGPVKTQQSFGEMLGTRAVVEHGFPGRGLSGCQFLCSPAVQ